MKTLIQKQCHSAVINTVNMDTPKWVLGDGMITFEKDLALIVYGADCSIITFWDDDKIGVCHAGWKGLVGGIIDRMAEEFIDGQCHVGPLLSSFEIQPDDCYQEICSLYGEKYFSYYKDKIFFNFEKAVLDRVRSIPCVFDGRDTFSHKELASWRRDKKRGDGTQNRLVIWRDFEKNNVNTKLFLPNESIKDFFCKEIV